MILTCYLIAILKNTFRVRIWFWHVPISCHTEEAPLSCFVLRSKDENIGNHGYISTSILRIYQKYIGKPHNNISRSIIDILKLFYWKFWYMYNMIYHISIKIWICKCTFIIKLHLILWYLIIICLILKYILILKYDPFNSIVLNNIK